ncbi:T9SS type A sorting domain-containing protein [Alkaliflexus imshenetskii]|uniref:T9SS type A sorting domain-containing protein n=1 Tax=Alkaliflexus imshenetskii TaxID=286730 RepID=UPI000478FF04|nr:T9SS type A sorting domain-containing protein [Alkaliflexus imshenetskii]
MKNLLLRMVMPLCVISIFNVLLSPAHGQTTVNFDDASKWKPGSAAINSYAVDHVYEDGDFIATGGAAMRNTATTQDGFPGALGTYSWRLRDDKNVEWIATIKAGGVKDFSVDIRRWDGSPSPAFNLECSVNNGDDWHLVSAINNETLESNSGWKTFSGSVRHPGNNILIRLKATGTTERIMVDNFVWQSYAPSISDFEPSILQWHPGDAVTFTWNCSDVDKINIQFMSEDGWMNFDGLADVDAADGSVDFIVPYHLTENPVFKVRIVDAENPNIFAECDAITFTDNHFAGIHANLPHYPAQEATDVATDLLSSYVVGGQAHHTLRTIRIWFNEAIIKGTGTIEIYRITGETHELFWSAVIHDESVQIQNNLLSINVGSELMPMTEYRLVMLPGTFFDTAENPNTFSENITWVFATRNGDSTIAIADVFEASEIPAKLNQVVKLSGVVTHINGENGVYIQDDTEAWSAIYVQNSDIALSSATGDLIRVTGEVKQTGHAVYLNPIMEFSVVSGNNPVVPIDITLPFESKWQNMLVTIENVRSTGETNMMQRFKISDGSHEAWVCNAHLVNDPTTEIEFVSITGILVSEEDVLMLLPRSMHDFVSKTSLTGNINHVEFKAYLNPSHNQLHIKFTELIDWIAIYDITGKRVYHQKHPENEVLVSLDRWPGGTYLIKITTRAGQTAIQKVVKR